MRAFFIMLMWFGDISLGGDQHSFQLLDDRQFYSLIHDL